VRDSKYRGCGNLSAYSDDVSADNIRKNRVKMLVLSKTADAS